MKKTPFGAVREWETALLTLPEESFFSLVRSVFGSVKTPFSKQRLVDDLKAFLSNEENQKTLEAYIDEKDALLIASVAVLGSPAEQELADFIGGELNENVHACLINMEERLIVYRFKKGRIAYIALNPLLESVLGKFARNTRRLFPSVSRVSQREEPDACLPVIDDRFIAASFSFALEKVGAHGSGLGARKNGPGKTSFPYVAQYGASALQVLELLIADDSKVEEKLSVNARNVARFGKLSPRERIEYYITGVYLYLYKTGSLQQRFNQFNAFHQGQVKTIAAFVHQFLDFFNACAACAACAAADVRWYPRITLQRIAVLLQRRGLGADQDRSVSLPNLDALLSCLETLGILIPDESSLWRINPAVFGERPRSEPKIVLTMDTEFSCILYPGVDFSDALDLAFFSEVREMGAVVRFELTRESVVRGFDRGISADAMIRLLNRLSGGQVSHNVRYCLNDWEDRRRSVSLHYGLVLCLDEEQRYLAEIEPFSRFITQVLAPGVYLLYNIERSEAIKALRHVGVDIVAQSARSASGGAESGAISAFASDEYEMRFPALASSDLSPLLIGEPDAQEEALPLQPEQAALYLERFRRALDNSAVPKSKREELNVHIENRLILNEEQLSEDCVSYKKMEAHLLDQAGKISIIREAVAAKSTLDIRWITMDKNGQGGGHERYAERHAVGVPKKLEKTEGKRMLFLETQEGELRIPLRKILCIRKIKKSIFE